MFPCNSMKIQLRSATNISRIIGSRKTYIDIPELSTLLGLLGELTDIYGQEFYDAVCDETGYPANKVAILVNGSSAAAIGGVDIQLRDGDDVLILPMLGGG